MSPLTCHLLRLRCQGRVLQQGRIFRQGRALRQGGALRQRRSLRQGTTPAVLRWWRPQLPSLVQVNLLLRNFPWVLLLLIFFLDICLTFLPFSAVRSTHCGADGDRGCY